MTIINQKSISGITSITFASAGDDLLTFHSNNGTERFRIDNSGNTKITAGIVTTLTVTGNGTVGGTLNVTGETTFATHINLGDNDKAIFGAGDDLQIYHDGSNSVIKDNGTGKLILDTDGAAIEFQKQGLETIATFNSDGAVELYYDNDLHFATTSLGCKTNGDLSFRGDGDVEQILFDASDASLKFTDNKKAKFGDGDDLEIYHDGTNSWVKDVGTNALVLDSNGPRVTITKNGASETMANFNTDGAVELYYDNSKKFVTKSDGIDVTGEVQCDSLDVDGTSVFMPGSSNQANVVTFSGGDAARGLELGTKGYNGLNDGGVVYNAQTGGTAGSHHFQVNNGVDMVKIDHHGLKFGSDTAAANALDDYEEGTFTATCANSVTLHSDTDLLQYVKIGASVTVMGQIRVNSSNSGSSLTVNNLPFTVYSSGEGSAYAVGAVRLYSADMASDHKYVICVADGGTTNLTFQGVRDNNTSQGLGASDNGYYMFSVTYRTT